ncbi:acyltransferase [Echinicola soli]|uniref:Acyltransferase n=1 Tax=Echinicola soli TaxID=2591634 RepID=A0A514CL55_9BACT|nr:acyltransferase family protein [Echinicola soli]QDH80542.1 acyltransferase [Echinicola soli]
MSSIKYRPEIDGLRSIAVVPVILFHLGLSWITGGFYGVDVFFVISGYLITSIIVKNLDSGKFTFQDFWLRRVRRIMPALIGVILFCFLVFPFLIYEGDIKYMVLDGFAALFSVANFNAYINLGDYWGGRAETSFFLHAWSLSVEEQFYLAYPLILFLLHKWGQPFLKWVIAIVILSFGLYCYGVFFEMKAFPFNALSSNSVTFYMIPSRAWELGIGCITALLVKAGHREKYDQKTKAICSLIGLMLIVSSYLIPTDGDVSLIALLPTVGTGLFIFFANNEVFAGKILSNKPIVFIGKISYSLYLWHWPFCVLFHKYLSIKYAISETVSSVLIILLTTIFSILSYYLIEERTHHYNNAAKLVGGLAITILCFGGLYMQVIFKDLQAPFNYVDHYFNYYSINPELFHKRSDSIEVDDKDMKVNHYLTSRKSPEYNKGGLIIGNPEIENPEIVVIGDSHGCGWGKVLNEISDSLKTKTTFYVGDGMFMHFPIKDGKLPAQMPAINSFTDEQARAYGENVLKSIDDAKLVIITNRLTGSYPRTDEQMSYIEDFIRYSTETGAKVLLINQPPLLAIPPKRQLTPLLIYFGYRPNDENQYIDEFMPSSVNAYNKRLYKMAEKYKSASVFNSYDIYKNQQKGIWVIDKKDILYRDINHLSYQGTLKAKEGLYRHISGLLSPSSLYSNKTVTLTPQ